MDFSKLQLFSMMKQRMAYGSERQAVLAQNIANANTPKYKAKDLKPLDFKEMAHDAANKLPMAATQAGHMQSSSAGAMRFEMAEQRDITEVAPNGNNVTLEDQMMKMQSNNTDYQTTTSLYRRMTEMFNISIGPRQ
jgi:flagellar basal-body rod protein FlgB